MSAREFNATSKNPPVRSNKVLLTTVRGFFVFRDVLGRLFPLAIEPVVTLLSPLTGATTLARSFVSDETTYLTPAGTIAAHTFTLPSAAESRVGQIRRLQSSQIITALTVNVAGGGAVAGASLTAAAANTTYAWQFVSAVGGAATWLRIQ